MKKAKTNTIKVKRLMPAFIVALAAGVIVRLYQYFTIIDAETGFYTSINWSVYALYIILGIFSLMFIVISFVSSEAVSSKPIEGKSKLLGTVSIIFAAGLIIDAIQQISSFVFAVLGYAGSAVGLTLWKYVSGNGYIPAILEAVFALGAAVYMIIFGVSFTNGKNTYQDSKLLALNPMLWAVCRMISRLMRPISYSKLSELLIELFSLAFLMMAFLAFARISSQLSEKGSMRKLFAYGFPAVLFCFVCSVPRLVLTVIGKSSMLTKLYKFDVAFFASGIFLIVYIGTAMYLGSREVPEEIKEEEASNETDDNFLSEE